MNTTNYYSLHVIKRKKLTRLKITGELFSLFENSIFLLISVVTAINIVIFMTPNILSNDENGQRSQFLEWICYEYGVWIVIMITLIFVVYFHVMWTELTFTLYLSIPLKKHRNSSFFFHLLWYSQTSINPLSPNVHI